MVLTVEQKKQPVMQQSREWASLRHSRTGPKRLAAQNADDVLHGGDARGELQRAESVRRELLLRADSGDENRPSRLSLETRCAAEASLLSQSHAPSSCWQRRSY